MFENEGNEVEQELQSDVSQDSASESQNDVQAGAKEQAQSVEAKEVPFHEHPRWKEVMEERNAERQRSQALERQIAEMQRQFQDSRKQAEPKPQDAMYERLKGIDPEFAEYIKEAREQAALAKQLKEELSGMRQENFAKDAMGKFRELNKTNNVSPEIEKLYYKALDLGVRTGEIKTLDDLEKAYGELHGSTSKFLQSQERSIIEKYTTAKKTDAKTPVGQSKGRAPATTQKIEFSKDPQEAKAQLTKHIASVLKSNRNEL